MAFNTSMPIAEDLLSNVMDVEKPLNKYYLLDEAEHFMVRTFYL